MAFGIYHTFPFDEQFIFFKHFIQNRRSWEFYSVRKKESYFKCKMIANRRNNQQSYALNTHRSGLLNQTRKKLVLKTFTSAHAQSLINQNINDQRKQEKTF